MGRMGLLGGKLRHSVKSNLQLVRTGLSYKPTVFHGPAVAAHLLMRAPLALGRLSHRGTAGWQLPEEEEGIASPPSHAHYTPPCTNKYPAEEAPVAPGVGNRLHSSHPAPQASAQPDREYGSCFYLPHFLQGPVGSGLAAGAGPQLRMGVQHPGLSWTLSLKRCLVAQTCLKTLHETGPVFRRLLQSP